MHLPLLKLSCCFSFRVAFMSLRLFILLCTSRKFMLFSYQRIFLSVFLLSIFYSKPIGHLIMCILINLAPPCQFRIIKILNSTSSKIWANTHLCLYFWNVSYDEVFWPKLVCISCSPHASYIYTHFILLSLVTIPCEMYALYYQFWHL